MKEKNHHTENSEFSPQKTNCSGRILILNASSQIGGAEIGLLNILRSLHLQFDFVVAAPGAGPLFKAADSFCSMVRLYLPESVVKISRFNRRLPCKSVFKLVGGILRAVLEIWKLIGIYKPDIVYSNGLKTSILTLPVSFFSSTPMIIHIRDIMSPGIYRTILKMAALLPDVKLITNSHATADALGEWTSSKCTVIYNGVDFRKFDVIKKQNNERNYVHLLCVGHLAPVKGYHLLIKALSRIKGKPFKCTIIGGDVYSSVSAHNDYKIRLIRMINKYGLEQCVSLPGPQEDISKVYKNADIFCMPSLKEGFGRAALEAMASSLPVIGFSVGGLSELVVHGKTGILIPAGDVPGMARAIQTLMDSSKLRYQMGKKGRRRAVKSFALENETTGIASVFKEVLSLWYLKQV